MKRDMPLAARLCSLRAVRPLRVGCLLLFFVMAGWFCSFSSAQAANGINRQISYQGKLLDTTGVPVTNGTYQMKFALYAAASGGTPLWVASGTSVGAPTAIPVTVQSGLFSILLGDSSEAGGWQNTLDGVDWNSTTIYLGVTIGSDSEMTPRKRLGAVPQAFNAERLQGMFASSTVSGGQTLFTVNQTENNAATGTRTALLVRSNGTSSANDYLLRGVNDLEAQVFSLNRQGSVTSSGVFAFTGSGTSTLGSSLQVSGAVSSTSLLAEGYLVANGTVHLGDQATDSVYVNGRIATSLVPTTDNTFALGSTALRWSEGNFVNVSSTHATSTYLFAQRGTFGTATSTLFDSQLISAPIYATSSFSLLSSQSTLYTEGIAVGDRFLVTFTSNGFQRFDISSSTNPISLGTTPIVGGIQDGKFLGRYFFVAQGSDSFVIYDTSSGSFVQTGSITLSGGTTQALWVEGKYAFVLLSTSIVAIDISDVSRPRRVGSVSTLGSAASFWIRDGYAFTLESGNLRSYNILNPSSMFYVNSSVAAGNFSLIGSRSFLYSVSGSGFFVTNARTPASLATASSLSSVTGDHLLSVGNYVLVSDGTDVRVVDVSNSIGPQLVMTLYGVQINDLEAKGEVLFTVGLDGRLKVYRLPSVHVATADIGSLETHLLSVSQDGRIAGSLSVNGGFQVGYPGIFSQGPLSVSATGTTSTFMGGLLVGTSTVDVTAHSSFVMSGDDLFVAGNIGSATSVYTNGSFIAGSNTYYNNDSIIAQDLGFTVSSTGALNFRTDSLMNINPRLGINVAGTLFVDTSSTNPTFQAKNQGSGSSMDSAWGGYVDRLLIGDEENATGTNNFAAILSYNTSLVDGLCLKRNDQSCPDNDGTVYSLIASDIISASNAFDLAESYALQGAATTTDVLVFGSDPATMTQSSGLPYDSRIAGVYSSRPGFLLGMIPGGVPVALTGRVPTKVSTVNGSIGIGDPLTTSEYPGTAMKATKPGMILGYALEAANTTSTIEVFVKTGYSAGTVLNTDGRVARLTDDLVVDARRSANVSTPTADSWGITFRGSVWEAGQVVNPSFGLFTQVTTPTSSSFVITNSSSSSVFSINQAGAATITGDLVVGGRLYPSGRGTSQRSKYIFVDDTSTSTQYIATNADGWQANDAYDFAERYYSPDRLETGDLVIASDRGRFHVQRSLSETGLLMGIVSTRPAFVAGRPDPDTYPIALAGRVPTKVSAMNGAIKVGDALAPSTIPGTAVKATKAGPIVGLALEAYDAPTVGKIEVFVNPGWWGGPEGQAGGGRREAEARETHLQEREISHRGFALVEAGSRRVHVAYDSVLSYPNIQVTPRGEVRGGWWTDNYTDIGFDLFLYESQSRDVTFAWSVQGTPQGTRVYRSDGTYALVNASTGEAIVQSVATTTEVMVEPIADHPEQGVVEMLSVSTSTSTNATTAFSHSSTTGLTVPEPQEERPSVEAEAEIVVPPEDLSSPLEPISAAEQTVVQEEE